MNIFGDKRDGNTCIPGFETERAKKKKKTIQQIGKFQSCGRQNITPAQVYEFLQSTESWPHFLNYLSENPEEPHRFLKWTVQ